MYMFFFVIDVICFKVFNIYVMIYSFPRSFSLNIFLVYKMSVLCDFSYAYLLFLFYFTCIFGTVLICE